MNCADSITSTLAPLAAARHRLISGPVLRKDWQATVPVREFLAVKEEWRLRTDAAFREREGWNIRLTGHGTIACHLTSFQKVLGKIPTAWVEALMRLDGQHPTALVIQRSTRRALMEAVGGRAGAPPADPCRATAPVAGAVAGGAPALQSSPWTVQPAVIVAVEKALREYNAVRAPLRPLNAVQRLGYLDEEDSIEAMEIRNPKSEIRNDFLPGRRYPLETETIEGQKLEARVRPEGIDEEDTEDVLVTGQELLIRIKGESGAWHAFTHYPLAREQAAKRPETEFHTLAELVAAFVIPEVADVATLHPAEFAEMQRRLRLLERGIFDFTGRAAA